MGIARALVTNPDVLLMDEAFFALDVLTSESLRTDILELWDSKKIPTKGILIASHNIEEAVMMADRSVGQSPLTRLSRARPGKTFRMRTS